MRSRLLPNFSGRPRPATAQFAQARAVRLAQMTAYIDAVQRGDQAAREQALADMSAWVQDTSTWFGTTNEVLPRDQLVNGLTAHGQALAAAVNAQADNDWSTAYARNREATDHDGTVSDTIVQATDQKYPETFAS